MANEPPRRCIRFSAGYVDLIRSGRKQITFRAGRRRFRPGERVEGRCAEGVILPLRITGCETKPLREVSEEEARADLFESREVVLEGMRKFYPAMTWETEISLIRFEMADDAGESSGAAGSEGMEGEGMERKAPPPMGGRKGGVRK